MTNKIYIAFYKKKRKITSLRTLWYRVADDITKFVAKGIYSHCEIAIKIPDTNLYSCYSSSVRDGGVRNKTMELPEEDWDFIEITDIIAKSTIINFYELTAGRGYDWIGLIATVVGSRHNSSKWFCSEWCAECLGIKNPYKVTPVSLYKLFYKG